MARGQRGWICPGKGCNLCEKRGFLGSQQKGRQEMAMLRDSGYIYTQMQVITGFFSAEYRTRIWMRKRRAPKYEGFGGPEKPTRSKLGFLLGTLRSHTPMDPAAFFVPGPGL